MSLIKYFQRAMGGKPAEPTEPDLTRKVSSTKLKSFTNGSEVKKMTRSWWDLGRYKFHGKIKVKSVLSHIDLLTDTTPYSEECLRISVDSFWLNIEVGQIQIITENIMVSHMVESSGYRLSEARVAIDKEETTLLKVPQIEAIIKFLWKGNEKDDHYHIVKALRRAFCSTDLDYEGEQNFFKTNELMLEILINLPSVNNEEAEILDFSGKPLQYLIENSHIPIFHYQTSLISKLINLPQLRREYLLLYGIKPYGDSKAKKRTSHTGPLEDSGLNKKSLAVYSSYLELMTFTLNQQLNRQKNVTKMVSQVVIKTYASAVRVLMTNVQQAPNAAFKVGEEERNLQLIGVQSVLDSIDYEIVLSNEGVKAGMKARGPGANPSSNPKNLKWKSIKGAGNINLMYGAFFDGKHLISLKPNEFRRERLNNWAKSMNNPETFNEFFGLKGNFNNGNYTNENRDKPCDVNHLFDLRAIKDFKCFQNKKTTGGTSGPKSGVHKTNNGYFNFTNAKENDGFDTSYSDFLFSTVGIFFKASQLNYIQFKEEKVFHMQENNEILELVPVFENFLTLKGAKMLIGYNLRTVAALLFWESLEEARKRFGSKPNSEKEAKKPDQVRHSFRREESMMDANAVSQVNFFEREKKEPPENLYFFGFKIERPQFNMYDEDDNTQLLFASKSNALITIRKQILAFDHFLQDTRFISSSFFSMLELFSVPSMLEVQKKVYWLEDTIDLLAASGQLNQYAAEDLYEINVHSMTSVLPDFKFEAKKSGILTRLAYIDVAMFENIYYSLSECPIDFSQQIDISKIENRRHNHALWNGELRNNKVRVNIGTLSSSMNGQDFDNFFETLNSFINLVTLNQDKKKKEDAMRNEKLLGEIEEFGLDKIKTHLHKSLAAMNKLEGGIKIIRKSIFEFNIKHVGLMMTDVKSKPFLQLTLVNFTGSVEFSQEVNSYSEVTIKMKKIEMVKQDVVDKNGVPEIKTVEVLRRISKTDDDTNTLVFHQSYFSAKGIKSENLWRVVDNMEIIISPLVVNMTNQIINFMMEYMFVSESNKLRKNLEDKENKDLLRLFIDDTERYFKIKQQQIEKAKSEMKQEKDKVKKSSSTEVVAPNFFKRIRLADLRLYVTMESSNILVKTKDMKVFLNPFDRFDVFLTRKTVVSMISDYMKTSAISSWAKHKFLCVKGDVSNDEEIKSRELEEKRKMLLGDS
jgi:hypothetical protein